jgi:uncharacterized protein (DUF1800 family)
VSAQQAFVAVTRFGLGARPGELERAEPDPKAWLKQQLAAPAVPQLLAQFPSAARGWRN